MSELELNKENFESEVLNSDKPVLVDFWAPWCGPCRMMGPVIERLAIEAGDSYVVGKVNVDDESELAEQYRIMSIPTFKVFRNGQVVASAMGTVSGEKLAEMLGS